MANKKISALTSASTPIAGTEVVPIVQSSATVKTTVNSFFARDTVTMGTGGTGATTAILNLDGSNAAGQGSVIIGKRNGAGSYILGDSGPVIGGTNGLLFFAYGAQKILFHSADYGSQLELDPPTGNVTVKTGNIVPATAAKGINFTANTPQAGMTSQLLNWYEEGTWTPNQGSGLVVVGTFSSTGTYTRIGRQVTAYISIVGSTSVALVGSNQPITTNLPFSSSIAATGVLINSARSAFMGIQTAGTTIYCVGSVSATPDIEMTIVYTT
jgi:hypothetical protein